jgi:hypothetical protein
MEKLSGKICDRCRTVFYPDDRIVELCEKCAHTVWCLFNIYEDGSKELSSIHGTEESAVWFKAQNYELYKKLNLVSSNKIVEQEISEHFIL